MRSKDQGREQRSNQRLSPATMRFNITGDAGAKRRDRWVTMSFDASNCSVAAPPGPVPPLDSPIPCLSCQKRIWSVCKAGDSV